MIFESKESKDSFLGNILKVPKPRTRVRKIQKLANKLHLQVHGQLSILRVLPTATIRVICKGSVLCYPLLTNSEV